MSRPVGTNLPHGTRSRYQGSARTPGCRCDDCRSAHADYARQLRLRKQRWVRPYRRAS